jgi:hypothetical protein
VSFVVLICEFIQVRTLENTVFIRKPVPGGCSQIVHNSPYISESFSFLISPPICAGRQLRGLPPIMRNKYKRLEGKMFRIGQIFREAVFTPLTLRYDMR